MIPDKALYELMKAFCAGAHCYRDCKINKYRSHYVEGYCVCSNYSDNRTEAKEELYRALVNSFKEYPEYIQEVPPEYRKYIQMKGKII